MVNDIIEKLMDLDMELKPQSLWCTSTCKGEDVTTLKVGERDAKLVAGWEHLPLEECTFEDKMPQSS